MLLKFRVASLVFAIAMISSGCGNSATANAEEKNEAASANALGAMGEYPEVEGLESDQAKAGYMIGMNIAESLVELKDDIDPQALAQAIQDRLSDAEMKMSDEQAQQVALALNMRLQEKAQAERLAQAQKNLEEGQAFLAKNEKAKSVITTESGLQYRVERAGSGAKPTAANVVKVHYRGTLLDGSEFDSSYQGGQPIEFPLGNVIPGWTEGVSLMPVGSKYTFWIPAELAYGANPDPNSPIQPNATLVFEVELLEIVR